MTIRFAITFALLTVTAASADPTYVFFDPPGSTYTLVTGINANGVVAGDYQDDVRGGCKKFCGFLRKVDGSFETFDIPRTKWTMGVLGVNNANTVAGYYYGRDRRVHGFLRQENGTFVSLRVHGGDTVLNAINDSGVAAGTFVGANRDHGFVRLPDGRREIFSDGAKGSQISVSGINVSGVVAGTVSRTELSGFTRPLGGDMTKFAVTGCGFGTVVGGIDDQGDVAGVCQDSHWMGFLRDPDGTYHRFEVPPHGQAGKQDGTERVTAVVRVGNDVQVIGQAADFTPVFYAFIRHSDGSIETFDLSTDQHNFTGAFPLAAAPSGAVAGYFFPSAGAPAHGFIRTP